MQPSDVTEEDLAQWEKERQDFIKEQSHQLRVVSPEVWYAGCWLDRKLCELNCDDEIRHKITGATGQRLAYSKDHWKTAAETLERYKNGQWDEPGLVLAKKLLYEQYGPNPDPLVVFEDMLRAGFDFEELIAMKLGREVYVNHQ